MKYLILVLTLLCGSAHAKDVLYSPIAMEQTTGLPATIFLTNEESKKCPQGMLYAKLTSGYVSGHPSSDGKLLNELCWERNKSALGFLLLNLSNNQLVSLSNFGIVPGSGPEFQALNQQWTLEMNIAGRVLNSGGKISLEQARAEETSIQLERAAKEEEDRPKNEAIQKAQFSAMQKALDKRHAAQAKLEMERDQYAASIERNQEDAKKKYESQFTYINGGLFSVLRLTPVAIVMDAFSIKPSPKDQAE